MANFRYKTKGDSAPDKKPRVYFTCHSEDFDRHFDAVCRQIFKTHDCAIYYTEDMNEEIEDKYKESDLGQMNLFVIPVTERLLTQPNRAMNSDFIYAKENRIPVLPLMMEQNLDEIYSREDKFGELQYLTPYAADTTAIKYEDKLEKYLESVLISDEMAERIRGAFDAYIFLSYRKKDRHYANELMKLIHNHPEFRGIAIWYDEFLKPGESFRDNIKRMMQDSKLFTLLVTPSLLEYVDGEPNYVMKHEYPDAKTAGMSILPAEMQATDRKALSDEYDEIPEFVNPYQDEQLRECLANALSRIAVASNGNPEHNFLLGLAYLEGIDVERNRERALELITSAANANNVEAMKKLRDMYSDGIGVKIDHQISMGWAEKVARYYEEHEGDESQNHLTALNQLAICYGKVGRESDTLPLLEKIYKCEESNRGTSDQITLNALNNLAYAYSQNNEPVKSLEAYKKAYKLQVDVFGEKKRETLTILNNLAMAYIEIPDPDYAKALELNQKAYDTRRELFGNLDYDTIVSVINLASTYSLLGKDRAALAYFKDGYRFACDAFGEESPATLKILDMLAGAHASCNHHNKVLQLMEKSCTICKNIYGEESDEAISFAFRLATEYMHYNKFTKAVRIFEKIHPIACKMRGEKEASFLMLSIAACYRKIGNEERAREALDKFKNDN